MNNKEELVYQIVNKDYLQPYFKDEVELSDYSKIPIGEIAVLGTAFAPLAQFMSASGNASSELVKQLGTKTLYAAGDKFGNPVQLATTVKGESGKYIGTLMKNGKIGGQARFTEVPIKDIAGGQIAFDPVTAIMATELMYIAKEIKIVKQQQEDMFQYLLAEKRSELEGSLSFLTKVMNDYKDNFHNKIYKTSMHIKILDIKEQAEQSIVASKKHINSFLKKKKDTFSQLGSHFQNYQIALYLYAFSSFAEVIVLENFNSEYLKKVKDRIEEFSIEYRSTYTDCYNYIESKFEKAPQAVILDIGAKVGKKIGDGIAKTPIGDKTLIDEKIVDGSGILSKAKETSVSKHLNEFCNYKDTRTLSFIQMFDALNKVFNECIILFDSQNLYIPKIT